MPDRDSIELDPSDRRAEIARILARGVMRHKQHLCRARRISSEMPGENPTPGLEVLAETSLTVDGAAG